MTFWEKRKLWAAFTVINVQNFFLSSLFIAFFILGFPATVGYLQEGRILELICIGGFTVGIGSIMALGAVAIFLSVLVDSRRTSFTHLCTDTKYVEASSLSRYSKVPRMPKLKIKLKDKFTTLEVALPFVGRTSFQSHVVYAPTSNIGILTMPASTSVTDLNIAFLFTPYDILANSQLKRSERQSKEQSAFIGSLFEILGQGGLLLLLWTPFFYRFIEWVIKEPDDAWNIFGFMAWGIYYFCFLAIFLSSLRSYVREQRSRKNGNVALAEQVQLHQLSHDKRKKRYYFPVKKGILELSEHMVDTLDPQATYNFYYWTGDYSILSVEQIE